MGYRFNATKIAQELLGDIDIATAPDVIPSKHNAKDVLEEIRDGLVSRIEALNDEIGND